MSQYKRNTLMISLKRITKLGSKGQLIDVRQPEEFELGHIKNALLHSVENIETFKQNKNKTYYIYCKSGNRSRKASQFLAQRGYDVVNLDGGYIAYEEQHHNDNLSKVKDRELKIIVRHSIIVIYSVQDLLLILVKKSKHRYW